MGLARYIDKKAFDLTICGLRPDGHEESKGELDSLGVRSVVARFRPRKQRIRQFVEFMRDYPLIQSMGQFDLQHSMDFTPSPWEGLFHRRVSKRFMFSQRNLNENGHRLSLRFKSSFATEVICVSDEVVRFMRELGVSKPMTRIYPGIECDKIPFGMASSGQSGVKHILMVGHVARRKGLETGIHVVANLLQRGMDVRLRIAGRMEDSQYLAELEGLAHRLSVHKRVEFLGARGAIFELMRQSDLFLHAAHSEAFGMVLIEAMATGLPVVAPNQQGPKEIVIDGETGLLARHGDVDSYTQAAGQLLEYDNLRRSVSLKAREMVERRFDSSRMAHEFSEVYRRIMA